MTRPKVFPKVWFRLGDTQAPCWSFFSFRDVGILTIDDNRLHFAGRHTTFNLNSIDYLGFGTQGSDFINNWVNVQSGETNICFADGGWWGWRGHLAHGTRRILKAVIEAFPEQPEDADEGKSTSDSDHFD